MAFARTGTPPDPGVGNLLGGEAAEWERSAVTGFLLYGHRDREGKRVVDRFISTRGRLLPPGEVAALVALQQARASLFEVEGVQLGSGIDFRDLLTDERVHVHEVSATAQLKKWDVLFAWVMSYDDHLEMTELRARFLARISIECERPWQASSCKPGSSPPAFRIGN